MILIMVASFESVWLVHAMSGTTKTKLPKQTKSGKVVSFIILEQNCLGFAQL